MISITYLKKQYGDKVILNNINLTIQEGSVFGLIGPNGAGKSTLLKLIAGILQQDEGTIMINNSSIFNNPNIKKDIFLVSDEPYHSINDTLKTLKSFYQYWYPSFDTSLYDAYISKFSLDENKPIKNFSKGLKRQAFLILALAVSPKYLLLDEAFDGLDSIMRLSFIRAITKQLQEKQITVIISSHNLRELEDICDTFALLENNTILQSGQIGEAKQYVHKIQIAFSKPIDDCLFSNLNLLSSKIQSRVATLIVKGELSQIKQSLQTLQPVFLEVLPVTLEELFIYELEKKGYGDQNAII